jgi:acetyltransferase
LIVGASDDPQFGPVILFGHGGTEVEIVADRALALPPLNMRLAHDLIAQTRVSRLLSGYRDRPPADLDAIAVTLIKVAQLVSDFAEIVELDINPLLADQDGVIALDARVRVGRASAPPERRLAIRPYPKELEDQIRLTRGRTLLRSTGSRRSRCGSASSRQSRSLRTKPRPALLRSTTIVRWL